MRLTDAGTVKRIMEENGAVFKKKFGQNFLTSENVLARIAENADEGVLEIGPGIGSLTDFLCEKAKKVVSVEIDSSLIPILEKTMADRDNCRLVEGDALKIDLEKLVADEFPGISVSVCANLPYYITTPVLTRLLSCGVPFTNLTVMVQKEVASRLCAAPGSPEYGAISVFCGYYGKARKILKVPAGCFVPAPKVDSAVVRIDLFREPPVPGDPEDIFRVVRAAFGQRRKTLSNALSSGLPGVTRQEIADVLSACGVDPSARGETLSLTQFAEIAEKLKG